MIKLIFPLIDMFIKLSGFSRRAVNAFGGYMILSVLLSPPLATSANEYFPKIKGSPTEETQREIRGGDLHSYTISLQVNEYVHVLVKRQGIDLTLNIRAPGQSAVLRFENPAGPQSAISAVVMAEVQGDYKIEVRPVKKWAARGRYEIQIQKVVASDLSAQKKLLAQQRVGAARQQHLLATTESFEAALIKYNEALQLWREAEETFEEANTLQFIAQTYRAMGDLQQATSYYERTLSARSTDVNARAYTLLDQADAYYSLKSARDSLPFYKSALNSFRENNDARGQALALAQIALIQMRSFEWETARATLNEALDLNRRESDSYEEARVLNALGGVYDNQGQPEKAMDFYKQALAGFHQHGDKVREGNMYINLGVQYDTWGEWRAAFESYYKALDLMEAGRAAGDADQSYVNNKKASLFYNLGALYIGLGSYSDGLDQLNKSLALRLPKDRGPTLMWVGYAHVLMGNPQQALKYCDQALALQEPNEDPRRAQTYTVAGIAHDALNNHDQAIQYFNRALKIQQDTKTRDLVGESITLDKRGAAFAARGDMLNARKDLEAALDLWRKYKDRNGEALTLYRLARIERDTGNIDAGLARAEEAIKLIEPLRRSVAAQLRTSYFAGKVDHYELYVDLIMLSRRNDNSAERTASAFEVSELGRSRSLLDSLALANTVAPTDSELSRLIEQEKAYQRSVITKSAQRSKKLLKNSNSTSLELETLDRELHSLEREHSNVEEKIRTQYPKYAMLSSAEPVAAKDIRKELDADTLLLEFALGEKRSYAWVVTPDEIRGIELGPRHEIESVATRLLHALTAHTREEPNESFQQQTLRWEKADKEAAEAASMLSKMVLEPVGALLGQKRLVIVADGALQLVPFGVLPEPANSPIAMNTPAILIQNRDVISLPSASVLALQRRQLANRKPAPLSVAVLADPVFDILDERVVKAMSSGDRYRKESAPSGPPKSNDKALATALRDVGLDPSIPLRRLVKSRAEALDIARVAPGEQFQGLDFKASRATVMSGALSKYRYVHFATHGLLDLEHPELSGIVLSMFDEKGNKQDGYLRLYEIYNLNLPAELVVLSGCQTGIGRQVKGEGLIALTRGFMHAGAARVVASLWKVDDSATAELMTQFYREMFKNGKRPAAALRAAQIHLSQKNRWQSPHYWAGFVLQGEWR